MHIVYLVYLERFSLFSLGTYNYRLIVYLVYLDLFSLGTY